MAVTLNANTSTGFIATSDTSGVLQLQTGGTTAVTVDASQLVGIGTASPLTPLHVVGAIQSQRTGGVSQYARIVNSGGTATFISDNQASGTYTGFQFQGLSTASGTPTTYATIDGSGNVGIGTASSFASSTLTVQKDQNSSSRVAIKNDNSGSSAGAALVMNGYGNSWVIECGSTAKNSNALTFALDATASPPSEKMRIDSSGNLLVGTTSGVAKLHVLANAAVVDPVTVSNSDSGSGSQFAIVFRRNTSTVVGSIQTTNVATSYVTSSDYRLKENIAPMTGALDKVALLKPVTYKWNTDGSDGQGFIAHELQAVVPDAVTGEKDGTRIEQYEVSPAVPATLDEDGNELTPAVEAVMGEREVPKYQGIDTSFLYCHKAAIQEQQAIITSLTDRITALEGTTP
jgi:hypothetical protein